MTSSRDHWFAIAEVVAEIHLHLERARSDLGLPSTDAPVFPSIAARSRVLEARSPNALATVENRAEFLPTFPERLTEAPVMEPLFGQPLEPAEATATPREMTESRLVEGIASESDEARSSDIAPVRMQIRERLTWLRSELDDDLSAREAFQVLFPLVIHVDELTAVALGARASDWRKLQLEFFEIDDGGELFFLRADELLGQDDVHPLVFEVYYFCLSDGFVGRYGASPSKLDDYKSRLASRIPTRAPPVLMERSEANEVRLVEFPRRLYMFSAAAVLTVFLLLHVLSSLEVGAW